MSDHLPLTPEELESFRDYAIRNRTEPDGSQCQWADYTLRLISHVKLLEKDHEAELTESEYAVGDEMDKVCRLEAIVDKLPKTADGVPVVPRMVIFTPLPLHTRESRKIVEVEVGRVSKGTIFGREPLADGLLPYLSENTYSTREAAEAALKEADR